MVGFRFPPLLLALAFPALAHAGDSLCSGANANLKPAESYCEAFDKTGPLKSDAHVQAVKKSCVRFNQEAIATVEVFCAYIQDAKATQANGNALAAATTGQAGRRGSYSHAGELTNEALHVYETTLAKVEQQFEKMKKAESPYRKSLKQLAVVGEERLTKELHCEKSGEPGAEGAQIVGVAKYSLEAETELTGFLQDMLSIFHRTLYGDMSAASAMEMKIRARDAIAAGAIAGSDITMNPHESRDEKFSPSKSAAGLSDDAVIIATSQAGAGGGHGAGAAVQTAEKALVDDTADLARAQATMMSRAASGVKALLGPEAIGVAVLSAFYLGLAEKVDGLTLTSLGTMVLGTVGGASVGAMIGLGVATDMIETEIRGRWAKIDATIAAPYLNYVRLNPQLSSQAAASGFAPFKARRTMCQACPLGPDCTWSKYPYSKYNSDRTLLFGPTGKKDPSYDKTRVVTNPTEFMTP